MIVATKPRLGFLGVGFIGRRRLEALAAAGVADVAAAADPEVSAIDGLACLSSLDDLLELDLDGIVIATPNAFHAAQATRALERGLAVFCQKPLGTTAAEARRVVEAARQADRLLGVDLSYRHTEAALRMRDQISAGEIGEVFAADLVFHNSYGPRPWFWQRELSGGGCVLDLGTHLIDLALWLLAWPAVERVESRLHRTSGSEVENFAVAQLALATGATVRLACSWALHAGRDCVLEAAFFGTDGGVALRNVNGSFYDFTAELWRGTSTEVLAEPPDDWGGRATFEWAARLAADARFDSAAEQYVVVQDVVDRIYGGTR